MQCYWLYNFPYFRRSQLMRSVRKGVLRNFAKFKGKHLWQSLFFNKVAGCCSCFRSFSCLFLLKISCLFHFNRKMKWKNEKILWRSWNIYFFDQVSICLTSKISKEIWQMVIWSENVFKVSEYLFWHGIKKYCFLHKTIEKPYLNLHFKFQIFFPYYKEDMKILSFGFFSFPTWTSLV